jgi:hypothetical protein
MRRGTGILPVVRNHGQDAHATATPDGLATSLPETWANRAKQTQFPAGTGWGAAWGTRGVGFCTNKPNSCPYADPEIGVPGRANRAKQSQLAAGEPLVEISHYSGILCPSLTAGGGKIDRLRIRP